MYNVSDDATINCADGDACPVSMSNVTWEVEPPNQDNEMRMNDIIFFTSLTLENNGTTIQCTLSCSNCSNTRTSNTVTLIVNGQSINYRVISIANYVYEVTVDLQINY